MQNGNKQALDRAKKQMLEVRTALESRTPMLEGLGLDEAKVRRLIYGALGIVAQTEELMRCSAVSIARAVMQAAVLDLDIALGLGEAYLVPFGNICTLMPGYRGWQRKAREAGYNIESEPVYENDEFVYVAAPLHLEHKPYLKGDRGTVIGIYAYATPINHPKNIVKATWVTLEESEYAKSMSKSPAWKKWDRRMRRKLPISRLCKDLAGSHEGLKTIATMDAASEQGMLIYDGQFDKIEDIKPIPLAPPPELPEGRQKASTAGNAKEESPQEESPKRKRGRPKGSKNKSNDEPTPPKTEPPQEEPPPNGQGEFDNVGPPPMTDGDLEKKDW